MRAFNKIFRVTFAQTHSHTCTAETNRRKIRLKMKEKGILKKYPHWIGGWNSCTFKVHSLYRVERPEERTLLYWKKSFMNKRLTCGPHNISFGCSWITAPQSSYIVCSVCFSCVWSWRVSVVQSMIKQQIKLWQ